MATSYTPLTPAEIALLRDTLKRERSGIVAVPKMPLSPKIEDLVKRGYLKTSKQYDPINNAVIEDICVVVTEAGVFALEAIARLEPNSQPPQGETECTTTGNQPQES